VVILLLAKVLILSMGFKTTEGVLNGRSKNSTIFKTFSILS
jgi:hypothetical protein